MNLLPSFLRGERRDEISGLENPSVDLIAAITASVDGATSSNVSMTPLKALRLAAVYACVRVVARSVGSLPVEISQDDGKNGRKLVRDDPRWLLLNEFPNPEMTGMELFENWIAHAMLWGAGYLYVVRDGKGMPVELWPLMPDTTKPMRVKGTNALYYETELPGSHERVPLRAEQVIPIHAVMGMSPTMNARDMLATASAAQQYAGRFYQNNSRPGGIIQLPEGMGEEEMDEFVRRWKAGHEGLKRAQLVGILTAGATWTDVGISPAQAQFLETRQYAAKEIAMMNGVPPHRIGIVEPAMSRMSLEQQSIEFVTYTMREWLTSAEQAFRTKLFIRKDDLATNRYARFNVNELMRGDIKSRYEAHAIGVQWGFISRADVRRSENLPDAGDEAQLEEFLVPLNMIPASKLDQIEVAGKSKAGGGGADNTDNGGTQPTVGSDGSTPQRELDDDEEETRVLELAAAAASEPGAASYALLSTIMREHPQLADAIAQFAIEKAQRALPELPPASEDEPES